MKRTAIISLALLAVASVTSAATVTVIDYSPSIRFGGFEGGAEADFPNGTPPDGKDGWRANGQNRITNANDTGFGPGTGPTTGSGGSTYFGWIPVIRNGSRTLTNEPGAFNLSPLPLTNVSSVSISFDWAGSTTRTFDLLRMRVRVWNQANSLQQGFDIPLVLDGTPTTWENVSQTFNGPFVDDNLMQFSDIGKFRVQLEASTTGEADEEVYGHVFLDNVRLTFNVVPEPGSLALLVVGSPALLFLRRRRMK